VFDFLLINTGYLKVSVPHLLNIHQKIINQHFQTVIFRLLMRSLHQSDRPSKQKTTSDRLSIPKNSDRLTTKYLKIK